MTPEPITKCPDCGCNRYRTNPCPTCRVLNQRFEHEHAA